MIFAYLNQEVSYSLRYQEQDNTGFLTRLAGSYRPLY